MADPLAQLLAEKGGISFAQAFSAARARGDSTFRWNGKTYTTARADDKPTPRREQAVQEATRARREATDLMNLPVMPEGLSAKDRELWQYYTPQARQNRIAEAEMQQQQVLDTASDRAKIQQVNRQAAQTALEGMQDYELREAAQGAVNEEMYPMLFRMQDAKKKVDELAADASLKNIRDYEAREQAAEDAYRQQQTQARLRAQAIKPVYPEMAIPALRGLYGLLQSFATRSKPSQVREEPSMDSFYMNPSSVRRYDAGGPVVPADPMAGKELSSSSMLSPWAAPYVTDVLAKGAAAAGQPYQAFEGPLTAGESALQTQAFSGLAGLAIPTNDQMTFNPATFSADAASQYMNPYLMASLNPQLDEARRQADISRVAQAGRLSRAGAYGGGRQAIMESELNRNLLRNLGDITGRGYATAYDKAMDQFNREQNLGLQSARQAQVYGLEALGAMQKAGETQRGIEQAGITADIKQFEEERDYDRNMATYLRSLLGQGMLPISTVTKDYQDPSGLSELMGTSAGILSLINMYNKAFPTD